MWGKLRETAIQYITTKLPQIVYKSIIFTVNIDSDFSFN